MTLEDANSAVDDMLATIEQRRGTKLTAPVSGS
jgi:hypothetical protein